MLMFDYDRDIMQPPEEREERDPADWIFSAGQWIYVGDCQPMNREHLERENWNLKKTKGRKK